MLIRKNNDLKYGTNKLPVKSYVAFLPIDDVPDGIEWKILCRKRPLNYFHHSYIKDELLVATTTTGRKTTTNVQITKQKDGIIDFCNLLIYPNLYEI